MGMLAQRLGVVLRELGSDPSVWQGELHALASLEERDPKLAVERFHELKRRFFVTRRAELLAALRAHPFVSGVPDADVRGMPFKEIEGEIRQAGRSLAKARAIAVGLAEARALAASLGARRPPPEPAWGAASWDALSSLEEAVEAHRRRVAQEARLDARIREAMGRARRLRHHAPEAPRLHGDDAPEPERAHERLDAWEAELDALEKLEGAYDATLAPLRSAEVRAWRRESGARLEREAHALLRAQDAAALSTLGVRAEALRAEAAKTNAEAARSRRSGRAAPEAERRKGDLIDPYG